MDQISKCWSAWRLTPLGGSPYPLSKHTVHRRASKYSYRAASTNTNIELCLLSPLLSSFYHILPPQPTLEKLQGLSALNKPDFCGMRFWVPLVLWWLLHWLLLWRLLRWPRDSCYSFWGWEESEMIPPKLCTMERCFPVSALQNCVPGDSWKLRYFSVLQLLPAVGLPAWTFKTECFHWTVKKVLLP